MLRWFAMAVVLVGIVTVPRGEPVAERDSRQTEMIGPEAQMLPLALNRGQLVRFHGPASSVFVADPRIADVQVKSPTLAYVFGKRAGETSLFAVDSTERLLANLRVSVSHSIEPISEALRSLLPDVELGVHPVGDAVMLTGIVPTAHHAEEARALTARFTGDEHVLNRLKVLGPNQVNLRVRVAEVNRAVVKQIGVNWDSVLRMGSFALGMATGGPLGAIAGNTVTAGVRTGSLDINGVLDALENEGLVSVLAEPNLTAVSGETASFLAGGEFPITVPQADNTITIEFKKFGVGLAFTPTVLDGGLWTGGGSVSRSALR